MIHARNKGIKKGIKEKDSETSSCLCLSLPYISAKRKEYRNSKIRDLEHTDTVFLLILLLKMELELILLLTKNELL